MLDTIWCADPACASDILSYSQASRSHRQPEDTTKGLDMINSTPIDRVLLDLVAEYARIEAILDGLTNDQWSAPSAAPGWSMADTIVHLAQTEEGVVTTLATPTSTWATHDGSLDHEMNAQVRSASMTPMQIFDRWKAAHRSSVAALATADPTLTVRWAAAPLKPQTLATTRLAEHWAHMLDVTGPLGINYPDTDRLRHIAWLGHATLPYALKLAGLPFQPIRCTLIAPSGTTTNYGPIDAPAVISGSMGAFCRVGAQRMHSNESGLITNGPAAETALRFLRNYAA